MIDPTKIYGKALVVFFWSGLSASIVNMLYAFWHFNAFSIAWLVVLVNVTTVLIKNILLPPGGKR